MDKVRIPRQGGFSSLIPVLIPDLEEVRAFSDELHSKGTAWTGEAFGWSAEYNPEQPEAPLDSNMTFTPADFCIGESGVWFFSRQWENGRTEPPVEFLDDRMVVKGKDGDQ
jgi:hypothetical protein